MKDDAVIVETREYPQGPNTLVAKIMNDGSVLFGVRGPSDPPFAGVSFTVLRQLAYLAEKSKVTV